MVRHVVAGMVVLGLAGCAPGAGQTDSEAAFETEHALAEGSREAIALLDFLNDEETGDAALKAAGVATSAARAATLAHLRGPDGQRGTSDDDLFDTVGEFDAVKGVGAATINKVAAFALAAGYGSVNGLYANVYFTEKQVARTLELVNDASVSELDVDAYLDKRAAENIVAARPISSMKQLMSISRVKASALRLLRDHGDRTLADPTCDVGVPCPAGLWCTGGSTRLGKCVDTSVEGDGVPCSAMGFCGEDLVCAGRTETFSGMCNPLWMYDEFVNEGAASIPEAGSTGMSVEVYGLATVPTDAVIHSRITHARQSDLELRLENPSGTSVVAWAAGSGPVPETLPVRVPGDESVNGLWTLTVVDTQAGVAGDISLFTLELTSRFD